MHVHQQREPCSCIDHSYHSFELFTCGQLMSQRKHKRNLVSELHLACSWFYGQQKENKSYILQSKTLLYVISQLWAHVNPDTLALLHSVIE